MSAQSNPGAQNCFSSACGQAAHHTGGKRDWRTDKTAGKSTATAGTERDFAEVIAAFKNNRQVTYGGKGFGSTALKVNRRIFAMLSSKGKFVVKLPKERVAELVGAGKGEYFDPGGGRLMKGWLVVSAECDLWIKFAHEACRFVQAHRT